MASSFPTGIAKAKAKKTIPLLFLSACNQKLKNAISLYPAKIDAANANIAMLKARLDEAKRDLRRQTDAVGRADGDPDVLASC